LRALNRIEATPGQEAQRLENQMIAVSCCFEPSMSLLDRFRKRTEDEASRIARLSKTGRMTDGNIIDAVSDNEGRILQVTYTYELAGVLYESSQALSLQQQQRPLDYAPGKQIVVRYDPRRPANSIVV
jgi:hypothetical protein